MRIAPRQRDSRLRWTHGRPPHPHLHQDRRRRQTALGDGSRVAKTDPRIEAYADVDEANAAIGVGARARPTARGRHCARCGSYKTICSTWAQIYVRRSSPDPKWPPLRVTEEYVTRLEGWCDEFNARLAKLDSFILPGGTPGAALLHVARTVTRRAERRAWALYEADPERTGVLPAKYLNRLSDLLFILSRVANPGGDVLWVPGRDR